MLSPAEFRDRVAAAMKAATGQPVTVIDERTFKMKQADGTESTVSIDNAYNDYLASPDRLDAIVSIFARVLAQGGPAAKLGDLVIIVRPKAYLEQSVGKAANSAYPPPRALAGDIAQFLAFDTPEAIRLASLADLADLKIDQGQAWQRALSNLRGRIGPINEGVFGDSPGTTAFSADSGLSPSFLALPETCGPQAPNGRDAEQLLLFDRNVVFFGIPGNGQDFAKFQQTARAVIAAGSSHSSTVITCRGGRWVAVDIQ
ncbi:MAG: hypothetical protein A4S16_12565 [Proteobacteria bacterium SG_bin6]|nr:MAG: hypothetical protein A4S16_12565 [Proteobacteria bacterium SG_bin6]